MPSIRARLLARLPVEDRGARWRFVLYALHLLTLFGLALSNVFAVIAVVALPFTGPLPRREWRELRPVLLPLCLYVLFLLAAIAASYEPLASLRETGELFVLITLPLAFVAVRGARAARWLVDAIVLVTAALAALGLFQLALGFGDIDHRIRGPFSHYMTFAGFVLLADLLLVGRWVLRPDAPEPRSPIDRWPVALACFAAFQLALFASLTRNAWVGLAVALPLVVGLVRPRWLLAAIPAVALFVLLAPTPTLWRAISVIDIHDESNYDRLCMTQAGLAMVAERPLLGIGPDLVKKRYAIYRDPTAPRLRVPHLHNSYLELAAERGLLSLGAYLALMGASLTAAWRTFRRARAGQGGAGDLALGALGAIVAFAVAGLFENNWGDTEVQRLALFVLALPFCARLDGEEGLPG
ncbi:MAG: O-antigen ligase family protein [Thermoanaerobaculia bacterium]